MVAYDLTDPLEFVGYGSALTGLQVLKARNKDEANPSSRSFTTMATIGSGSSQFTELKVFNGTVPASSIPVLMADLRDQNLWVNRDGYCYIRIPGSNSSNPPRPTKYMRLNDLFSWKDYVDVPANRTFTPTPCTTVWNRHDSSSGTTKVDYEKLDADLKQAKDDKKKVEDELQEVRRQIREMNEWMERLKENWANASRVGARPVPPSAFYISSIVNPGSVKYQVLEDTWLGKIQQRISDPGSYMGTIRTGSIIVYDSANGYGNDGFETHFWWVVRLDAGSPFLVVIDGTGRYPYPTNAINFQGIRSNCPFGPLNLPDLGRQYVFLIFDI